MENLTPDYKRIYRDILKTKFPSKQERCEKLLSKDILTRLDIITIDKIILGELAENQKHRSYDQETIMDILKYQKKNKLNNIQLSIHFKLSRNTVAKWKKIFKIELLQD